MNRMVVPAALGLMLVGLPVPSPAQQRIEPIAGPIAAAAMREATRLSVEPAPGTGARQSQNGGTPPATWSAVRRLKPGTAIVVTTRGGGTGSRDVVSTDQVGIDLLNIAMLPARAGQALIDTARNYPLFATDARRGGLTAGSVRMGPSGVVVDGQKVAELDQVLERVAQNDVLEVTVNRAPGWSNGRRATVIAGSALAVIGTAVLIHYVQLNRQEEEQFERELAQAQAGHYACHCGAPYPYSNQKTAGGLLLGGGSIAIAAGILSTPKPGLIYRAR